MSRKRFRMVFKAKSGYHRRTVYSVCTEDEIQACKESWAMIIEEEIHRPVVCESVTEVSTEKS